MKLKNNTRFLIACILIVVVIVSSIIVSVTDRAPGSSRGRGPAVLKDPVTVTVSVEVDTNGLTGMLGSLEDSLSGSMDLIDSIVDLANVMPCSTAAICSWTCS